VVWRNCSVRAPRGQKLLTPGLCYSRLRTEKSRDRPVLDSELWGVLAEAGHNAASQLPSSIAACLKGSLALAMLYTVIPAAMTIRTAAVLLARV
jgi:hypothetical protein